MSSALRKIVGRFSGGEEDGEEYACTLFTWALAQGGSAKEAAGILDIPTTTFRRWCRFVSININDTLEHLNQRVEMKRWRPKNLPSSTDRRRLTK